jgi:hypothetical protein
MKIAGLGALHLDFIYDVDDLKKISRDTIRLELGRERFGSEEDFQQPLTQVEKVGALRKQVRAIHIESLG